MQSGGSGLQVLLRFRTFPQIPGAMIQHGRPLPTCVHKVESRTAFGLPLAPCLHHCGEQSLAFRARVAQELS